MFFDDVAPVAKKSAALRKPPIPETGWRAPVEFPNLSSAILIGIDTETKEIDFDKFGPGWARKAGHIVGVSLSAIDQYGNIGKWYFPLRHEVMPEDNLDPAKVFAWLKPILESSVPKVVANGPFDIGWLTTENIYVGGTIFDVQIAEALIDEEARTALDILGRKYLGRGKDTNLLYEWCAQAYGGNPTSAQRGNIYRAPPRLVGPYAEEDASLPLEISYKQWPILVAQELGELFGMECELIRLLVEMRLPGVAVDVPAAEKLHGELSSDIIDLETKLADLTGIRANVNSPSELAFLFDKLDITYPTTAEGKPSFRKEFLTNLHHPAAELINDIREHYKMRDTFIESYILNSHVHGRIYCQFHALKSDDGGTLVGRLSSSNPNLQNIPARTKLGKKVRKIFIHDYGHVAWLKNDFSQIHYRILAHYAVDRGDGSADKLRYDYCTNPKMDYHDNVYYRVCPLMGWDASDPEVKVMKRRPIKNVNFGLLYGQSEKSLAYKAGFEGAAAREFFKSYFDASPYIKPTMEMVGREVQAFGYITTILKRRVRFRLWEPAGRGERGMPLTYEAALREYGSNIRLAYEYRGVNYKFQGSEADIMKRSVLECYRQGIFRVTGMPRVLVHDETGFSKISESHEQVEAYAYMKHVLETTVKLRVPLRVDTGEGPNWGSIN